MVKMVVLSNIGSGEQMNRVMIQWIDEINKAENDIAKCKDSPIQQLIEVRKTLHILDRLDEALIVKLSRLRDTYVAIENAYNKEMKRLKKEIDSTRDPAVASSLKLKHGHMKTKHDEIRRRVKDLKKDLRRSAKGTIVNLARVATRA